MTLGTHVDIYRHSFFITSSDARIRQAIDTFCMDLAENEWMRDRKTGRQYKVVKNKYFTYSKVNKSYGFLKSDYQSLMNHLSFAGFNPSNFNFHRNSPSKVGTVNIKLHDWVKPKPRQEPLAAFLDREGWRTTTIHADTGTGKTFLGIYQSAKMQCRTAAMMVPGHIQTWIDDIKKFTTTTDKEILVITGKDRIRALVHMARENMLGKIKYIFLATQTMQGFFNKFDKAQTVAEFEELTEEYGCHPGEFWDLIQCGLVIRDEAHEYFAEIFRQTIYCNAERILYLSATLVYDQPFEQRMCERVFIKEDLIESDVNTHINVIPVRYETPYALKIPVRGFKGYSHAKYEKYILKRPKMLANYMKFLEEVTWSFFGDHVEGRKLLILSKTTDMVKAVAAHFQKRYPDMNIDSYYGGRDKKKYLYTPTVVSATEKGAGTGINIPGLSHCLNTIALGSTRLARQIMGRLRDADGEFEVYFYFLTNTSIGAHVKYDKSRRLDVFKRSKDIKTWNTGFVLENS